MRELADGPTRTADRLTWSIWPSSHTLVPPVAFFHRLDPQTVHRAMLRGWLRGYPGARRSSGGSPTLELDVDLPLMSSNAARLPAEMLEQILSTIEVLESCFPQEGELVVAPSSQPSLNSLRSGSYTTLSDVLRFILSLNVGEGVGYPFEIEIALALRTSPTTASPLSLRPPPWLSRARYEELLETMPPLDPARDPETVLESIVEDLLAWTDHLSQNAPAFLPAAGSSAIKEEELGPQVMDRVWFWL